MLRKIGTLRVGEPILLPQDSEFAIWSTQRTREMRWVPAGAYTCVLLWEAFTDNEGVATLFSPDLIVKGIIVDTRWGHTPGRTIMTPIPFAVGDEVEETKTGEVRKISHVLLHEGHCEHHYKFEMETSTYPISNLRWHHELKKITKPVERPKGLEEKSE